MNSAYPCPFWLPGGHIQTLYGALCLRPLSITFQRERLFTPDGDFLDLDWASPACLLPSSLAVPYLVLFHGLEGSSASPYAQAITYYFIQQGWTVVIAHFRGCSGTANRLVRAYHSGDHAEIDFIISHLQHQHPKAQWHAAGISLGGNALLKYLAQNYLSVKALAAAAAISAPMDLLVCGRHLSTSFTGRYLYTPHFLRSMKRKIEKKAKHYSCHFNVPAALQATTLEAFDNAYTAPIHGFENVDDYWIRASSKPDLKQITTPTLLLNALNDPFIPQESLPQAAECSAAIQRLYTSQGGHVGFVSGAFPGNLQWLAKQLYAFFNL